MAILKKIYDYFEEGMCAIMLSMMILCLAAQVVVRMTLGSSIAWTEELSRYTFLWTVYLGAALVAKKGAHVRVTAQFLKMINQWRMFFRVLADTIWICSLLFIAWNILPVIEEGFEFPEVSPTMHFAKAWVECVIPLSFVLIAWRVASGYYIRWKNGTLRQLIRFEEEV